MKLGQWPRLGLAGLLLLVAAVLSLTAQRSTGAPAALPSTLPIYLTWRAPHGDPAALSDLTVDWADSLRHEPMFLTFDTPTDRVLRLRAVSVALTFEPVGGDTLGPFWYFERNGPNSGNLRVDFDFGNLSTCETPWVGYVTGHVGYSHVASRGRLDLSCDVTNIGSRGLRPGTQACFARINVWLVRHDLPGWRQPMAIRVVGARFLTSTGKIIKTIPGPDARIRWNGGAVGARQRRMAAGAEAWVPVIAPPSRTALVDTAGRPALQPDSLWGH